MKIIASLNGQQVAVAVLSGHGMLTASVISLRRHPQRQLASLDEVLLVPELRLRLGGVRQTEDSDSSFTVLEYPLAPGDELSLSLKPESKGGELLTPPAREIPVPAEAPRLQVGVRGREQAQVVGQPGYGLTSVLLLWANRHPSRCERRHGALPQHQLQLQLHAHDNNALDVSVQHQWASPSLSPVDTIDLKVLGAGEMTPPVSSREHWL